MRTQTQRWQARTQRGHAWNIRKECRFCGMTRKFFDENGSPKCQGAKSSRPLTQASPRSAFRDRVGVGESQTSRCCGRGQLIWMIGFYWWGQQVVRAGVHWIEHNLSALASSAQVDTGLVAAYAGTNWGVLNMRLGGTYGIKSVYTSARLPSPGDNVGLEHTR